MLKLKKKEIKNESLEKNAFYNGVKQFCTIIFPLISFMYCSRILGEEQLGKYSFGQSIIAYMLLISGLGIPNYAVREGARYRNNRNQITNFVNEVFSINIILTIIAYFILFVCVIGNTKIEQYKYVIVIQSLQIILTTLGTDWLNSIYEDFFYLMIRYIFTQIVCLIGLILFVKRPEDIYIYTFISVLANSGGNILNFFYLRKKGFRIRFTLKINIRQHLRSILILFFNSVASVIYLNSDITMIGLFLNDSEVGIYTVSSKIYTMVKTLINAVIMVTVPRFSTYVANKEFAEYKKKLSEIMNILILLIIPVTIGLFMEAENIITIIAGSSYIRGISIVKILCIAIIFAVFSCFFSYSILLPNKMEFEFMIATLVAAIVNILSNVVLIPQLGINGAAYTTLFAEMVVFALGYKYTKKITTLSINHINIVSSTIGGVVVGGGCIICKSLIKNPWLSLVLAIIISIILYDTTLKRLHNPYVSKLCILPRIVKYEKK